jgi:phospholipase/lecithinase/hemolysin
MKLCTAAPPAALAALLATPSPIEAGTLAGFTDFYVFGDSLSDTGNFHAVVGQVGGPETVGLPYYDGRRSNGLVWSDHLAGDFETRGLAAENYAWIGATAVPNADLVPDLPARIRGFTLSEPLRHRGRVRSPVSGSGRTM